MPPAEMVKTPPCSSATGSCRSRPLAEVTDGLLDTGEVELGPVADDRDHEALVGADGDRDVIEVVLDDVLAVELVSIAGTSFDCCTAAFTKKDMKPSSTSILGILRRAAC
jgi:hypothetical protein